MFLIYGKDDFLLKKQVNKIINKVKEQELDLEYVSYSLLEVSWSSVLNDILTLDMFGNKKIIEIKDCYFLTEQKIDLVNDFKILELEDLMNNDSIDNYVIFTLKEEKISTRLKITKLFLKKCKVITLPTLSHNDLLTQIRKKFEAEGITYDENIPEMIIDLLPSDIGILFKELTKLCELKGHINADIIKLNLQKNIDYDVFKLVDGLIENNYKVFIESINNYFSKNNDFYSLFSLISTNVIDLRNIVYYKKIGYSQEELASKLTMNPYRVKVLWNKSNKFSYEELNYKIKKLNTINCNIINCVYDSKSIVEIKLLELMNKGELESGTK